MRDKSHKVRPGLDGKGDLRMSGGYERSLNKYYEGRIVEHGIEEYERRVLEVMHGDGERKDALRMNKN